jgi:16S rRNA processing protein RimM
MEEYLKIGQITNAHGIKGEVKIFSLTDNVKRFSKLKTAFLKVKEEYIPVEIESVKYLKDFAILKLAGVNDMNAALKFKNEYLYIDRDHAIKPQKDSYFIADLIGMKVSTDEGIMLGEITSVFPTGSNDVYEVKSELGKLVLLPAIKDVILEVDVENKKMLVKLIEGLI